MKKLIIALIRLYQKAQKALEPHQLPLLFAAGCRSWPTCSQYTIEAVEGRGVIRGLAKGLVRVMRCNPLISPADH